MGWTQLPIDALAEIFNWHIVGECFACCAPKVKEKYRPCQKRTSNLINY